MKCLIFTNGDYGDYTFCTAIKPYDYIICADNGMGHARHMGIIPDAIVGDFDSAPEEDLRYFKGQGVPVLSFPSMKDETDTEIALDLAIKEGADVVDIFGGMGTRLDHTLANINLVYKAFKKGVSVTLINAYNTVTLIDKEIELSGSKGDIISLIPFSERVSGIYTTALAYPLVNGTLTADSPRGVSNYMLENRAKVTLEQGLLLVIRARD